jgi:hypothetical protein
MHGKKSYIYIIQNAILSICFFKIASFIGDAFSVDGSKLFNEYGNKYIIGSEVLKILFLRYKLVLLRYNICKITLNFLNYQKNKKYLKKTEKNTFVFVSLFFV